MKKLKKIWNENRVLMVLTIILLVCFIVVIFVALTYFYGSSRSEYGNRLEGIDKVKITEKTVNKITDSIMKDVSVSKSTMKSRGKLIYLTINFVEGTTLDAAKLVAENSISLFSSEELAFYDINVSIKSKSSGEVTGFNLMGAKNSGGSGLLVWNNNRVIESGPEG